MGMISETVMYETMEKIIDRRLEYEFELLDRFSSAYCDKRMYFRQDDGMIYSRYSAQYMTLSDAIDEFEEMLR